MSDSNKMKTNQVGNGFFLLLKVLSMLTFTTICLYWSITAIIKFRSKPTTSNVLYKFGDDGQGNFDFPAVTICLESFNKITLSQNGMKYKCFGSDFSIANYNFLSALKYCTFIYNDTIKTRPKRGLDLGISNNIFNEKDVVYPFENIEDFLHVSNMIEMTDILKSFVFANGTEKNITIENSEQMKTYWKPTLHFENGLCYTFDPKKHGRFQANPENLLSLQIEFDVS